MFPLDRIMKWNSSAIITIFTTIKIMTCGELVGCVESHGGAGCLPRVNSNAHGAQCAQHILAAQVRFNEIFFQFDFSTLSILVFIVATFINIVILMTMVV